MLPDWSQGWRETLTWGTAIASSRDGLNEERRIVRPVPGRWIDGMEWVSALRDAEILGSWSSNLLGYRPGTTLANSASTGTTVAISNPALLGYEVDGWLMAIADDGTQTAQLITDVTATTVELAGALTISVGDVLMPGMIAKRDTMPITWLSPQVRIAASTWEVQTPPGRWDSTELGGYDDLDAAWDPVETFAPYGAAEYEVVWWLGDQSDTLYILEDRHDAPGGAFRRDLTSTQHIHLTSRTRTLFGRQEIWSARRMLYRRAGRYNGAFIPAGIRLPFLGFRTYAGQDFAAFTAGANVESDLRRALAFVLEDGTREYVPIETWHEEDDMVVSVTAGEVWTPVDEIDGVVSVDWLMFARLDADAVSIQHASPTVASITLGWRSLPWPPQVVNIRAMVEIIASIAETYTPPVVSETAAPLVEVEATVSETYTPPPPTYPTDAIIFFDETTARWQEVGAVNPVTTNGASVVRLDNDGTLGGYMTSFGTAPTHDTTSDAETSVDFGGSGGLQLNTDHDELTIVSGQGFEIFAVITNTAQTGSNKGVCGKWNVGGSTGEWILMNRDFNSPNAVLFGPKNYYNRGASGDQVNDGNPHILGGRVSTSDVAFVSIDGYDVNSGTTVSAFPSNGADIFRLGAYDNSGTTYFDGRIGELHVFDYELSASQRTAMIDYLNAKWGVDVGGIPSFIDYAWEVDELTGYSDGDTLTGWPNAKGGVDMTVTSAPKWYAGGGSPYVQLSGGYLNAAIGSKSQPNTVIMVWNNSSTGSVRVFTDSPSGARNSLWFETDGTLKWSAYAGESAPYSKTASPAISTGLQMSACVFNGSSTIIRVNGTTSSAMTSTGTSAMNGFRFGANVSGLYPPLAADKFYAVYVVDGALTTAQLDAMQAYCQSKWGTP